MTSHPPPHLDPSAPAKPHDANGAGTPQARSRLRSLPPPTAAADTGLPRRHRTAQPPLAATRLRSDRWYRHHRLLTVAGLVAGIAAALLTTFATGCRSSADHGGLAGGAAGLPCHADPTVNAGGPVAGGASIRLAFQCDPAQPSTVHPSVSVRGGDADATGNRRDPSATLRADGTGGPISATAFVVVRLLSLFPGQPAAQALASRTVTVPVAASGTTTVTIDGLPVAPTVVRIRIQGGTLAGLDDFQGAADLGSGTNTLTVHPTGSGLTQDLAAQVLLAIAATPQYLAHAPSALVTATRAALGETLGATVGPGVATAAAAVPGAFVPAQALARLLPTFAGTPLPRLQIAATGETLAGPAWTATVADLVPADLVGGAPLRDRLRFTTILPHGPTGTATVLLTHPELPMTVAVQVTVQDGQARSCLFHRGPVSTAWVAGDGVLIFGGYDPVAGCPMLGAWDGGGNARTASGTTDEPAGLRWLHRFTDLAVANPTGAADGGEGAAALVHLVADGVGGVAVAVRLAGGMLRHLRFDARRGTTMGPATERVDTLVPGITPAAGPAVELTQSETGPVLRSAPLTPVASASEIEFTRICADQREFSLDLYRRLAARDQGNLFCSPYSVWLALAMTAAGADSETALEMAQVLRFRLPPDRVHPAAARLQSTIASRAQLPAWMETGGGDPFILRTVNDLWGQRDQYFAPDFLGTLAAHYGAGLRLLDFVGAPEPARAIINDYVASATAQRITNLLPEGSITPLTRLVLTNAVYFKATWAEEFTARGTTPMPWTGLDGTVGQCDGMSVTANFSYRRTADATLVELPYLGNQVAMLVVMPDAGRFAAVEAGLDDAWWASATAALGIARLDLRFPKFTHRWDASLREPLIAMGMPTPFSAAADFSRMNGVREFLIHDVYHKSFVAVDEQGTEAAAATAVVVGTTSVPADPLPVRIDRPFIYAIRDRPTGAILFIGRVVAP